ncbi:MAG: ABC transporter permease [Acidobacteriia bacterium]|nr:ABC transporter permease [Terriglobia bacterium]
MQTLWQDAVYGVRMLAKRPVFAAVAALSLALGIGLNTAIFTLINTILWGRLAFEDPARLVAIWSVPPGRPNQLDRISVPDYLEWQRRARSFSGIGAMNPSSRDFGAEQDGTPAERFQGEEFSAELLQTLGVRPFMGRLFTPEEAAVDHPAPVILISRRLWQRRFNGDQDILNRSLLVDGVKTSIVGVLPQGFVFSDDKSEFIAPIRINHFQVRASGRFMIVAARLKPGVSIAQAQSEMEALSPQIAKDIPGDMDQGRPWTVRVQPIREGLFGFMSKPLLLLQGAVAFVLLIACANVAALLLARASSRRTEVAVRSALGAGRLRIFRQFLIESMILSIAGGALGVMLAWWGVQALVAMAPSWFPRLHEISIDGRVLLFSLGISLLTGILFGIAPAMEGSKTDFADALKDATRGGTSGGGRHRIRAALVTAQLALALVLLIGSGLLIRSFLKLQGSDLGCDPRGILTFMIRLPQSQAGAPRESYKGVVLWEIHASTGATLQRIFERVQSIPGVQSAAASVLPPLADANPMPFSIEGRATPDTDVPSAMYFPVSPNFFQTMKIAMLRGRDFTMHDTASSQWVAIVNETMAKRYWPNENPLGKRINLQLSPEDQPREIVAVVHDTPSNPLQTRQDPMMYVPVFQAPPHIIGPWRGYRFQLTFLLRTQGDPMRLVSAAQHAVAEIDPNRPLANVQTEEELVGVQIQYPRYYSMLLGLFAAVATLLAAVGIYGVMAYAVEQRTREIGIRMALGADVWNVLRLVMRQTIGVIAAGLVLGVGGAMALTRFISSELWEVQSSDPTLFAGVSALLAFVALVACFVPTRRAVRVDPTIALRYE